MKINHLINGAFILYHALKYKVTRRRLPLMVSIGLTNRCNLHCPFCYARKQNQAPADYTTGEIISFIDQFVSLGTRIFLLQGGEPLLRGDLSEIISYIKARGRYCRISTNGLLVSQRIDALRSVDQISFSLDGNEAVVSLTRGTGVYEKVIAGMEAAYAAKIPFEIHASLIRESLSNRNSLMHLLELGKRFRTYISFCVTCVSGADNTKSVGSGDLSSTEIKDFYRLLIQLKKQGYPVSNSFNSLRKSLDWPLDFAEIGYRSSLAQTAGIVSCKHGRLICWLDADKTLYPCPATFGRPEFAVKIRNNDIRAAWRALAEKVNCLACGGSDESTTFFDLRFEDLAEGFLRLLKQ